MAVKKRIWIPLLVLVLLSAGFVAAWYYVPTYAEARFVEKLEQVGIETDSIEFRIEGFSRPVVRDLSVRVSGINLIAEMVTFGSLFDGYGKDKPLKVKVHGLWSGVNAQIPEGILSVNNAILALPEKPTFASPIPIEIEFEDGTILYENQERQIEGKVDGKLSIEDTVLNWELSIDVSEYPIKGRGFFDWETGRSDIAGEMNLSHTLSRSIWDILNEEPLFDWNAGELQAAFRFEGENYRYQNGQIHAIVSSAGVGFESLDVKNANHVASIIWTPRHITVEFDGNGALSKLLDAPFSWAGTLSWEPGPIMGFELYEASIAPEWSFGSFNFSQSAEAPIPLEISLLGNGGDFDFQVLGIDLQLGGEFGEQLASSTLDLMINGQWKGHKINNASVDLWLRDGIFMAPMFQAEFGGALLNARIVDHSFSDSLFPGLFLNPGEFVQGASMNDARLYRYEEVIGESINLNWSPGEKAPLSVEGNFAGIGEAVLVLEPDEESTRELAVGRLSLNPGDFVFNYAVRSENLFEAFNAKLILEDYAIQDYPDLAKWLTGEFDITGFISAEADLAVTPDSVKPLLEFQLENVLYASGNLVMDDVNFAGRVDSWEPFNLKTKSPLKAAIVQVNGWPITDLYSEFEIGNRINITNTTFSALGGELTFADISVGKEDLFVESEIGVKSILTDEVLQWIPKVIGMAEGSISGVIPFQWDIKNNKFSLGRGHLQSPEGELGFMNLKIFRPEDDENEVEIDDRYSMVDEALSNLQDSSLDIDILPPNSLSDETRVRINIKGFVDSRFVKAPVDVVRYYSLPVDSLMLTMEQVRQDLPGIKDVVE